MITHELILFELRIFYPLKTGAIDLKNNPNYQNVKSQKYQCRNLTTQEI